MNDKRRTVVFTVLLAGVLLAASFTAMAYELSPKMRSDEIGHSILKRLSYNDDAKILSYLWGPVSKGDTIQGTKETIYTVPCSGYVMYIDLLPMANLFHPVRYVFLAEPTQELSVFDGQSPPLNFKDYQVVDTSFSLFFFSVGNQRPTISQQTAANSGAHRDDSRYAVLMNGGYDSGNNHVRYWNDLSNIYITLNHVYDFPDENIIVLCSDGLDPTPDQSNGQNSNPDLDGDGDADIMYSCVLANVDRVFANLAANFTERDKLFVFTTDHGSSISGWNVYENLWNHEQLIDAHFQSLLAAFPVGCEKICTFEPCFSGGFLDNIIVPPGPIVASSACAYNEYSYAMSNLIYDEYVFHWTAAVKGKDAYGNPVNADTDGNGKIEMDEAFLYAKAHDIQPEHPQYGEYPNGTGEHLSLWVTSNPPAKPSKPLGPTLAIWHVEYSFTSTTTDPDGDQIFYKFDWGDGSNSGWLGPYNSGQPGTGSHNWTVLGTYNVTVKAQDVNGATSLRSDPLVVTVTDNTPPLAPQITGPSKGNPGKKYVFDLQTTDPQNNDVYYYIDWGDGSNSSWLGPYVSGFLIHVLHSWAQNGNYTVMAKAKDTFGAESNWSIIHIPMPSVYLFSSNPFLQQLFMRHPNLLPKLRQLMGY